MSTSPLPAEKKRPAKGRLVIECRRRAAGIPVITSYSIHYTKLYEAQPPEAEPLVALSDLAAWQEEAGRHFEQPGPFRLVSLNVMRKLHEWFAEPAIWQTLEALAEALLERGELDQAEVQRLLAPLPAPAHTTKETA